MKTNTMKFFLRLTVLVLLASCSVTQRHYMPGYSVEWNTHKQLTDIMPKDSFPEVASADTQRHIEMMSVPIILPDTEKCDEMTMTNGDIVKGKVEEIDVDKVKYKDCDNLSGPIIDVNKSSVFEIKYSNGQRKVITPISQPTQKQEYAESLKQRESQHTNGNAIAGMILGILSLVSYYFSLPLAIVGLILSIKAKKQIAASGERGIGMAKAGVITSIIGIAVWVIIILILLGV